MQAKETQIIKPKMNFRLKQKATKTAGIRIFLKASETNRNNLNC